jgi:hypothetical protein
MAQDASFIKFIKHKKDAYDKGTNISGVASLMDAAKNMFKTGLLLKAWSAPTKEQEQSLAFTAQVNHFQKMSPLLQRGIGLP